MTTETKEKIVDCTVSSDATRLKLIRSIIRDVAEYLDIEKRLVPNLVLAVNEACMNIIQHAYKNQSDREIGLKVYSIDEGVVFVLRDDAPCVEPAKIMPRDLSDIRPGGLGLHFINTIMDKIEYQAGQERGNTLVLTKYIQR